MTLRIDLPLFFHPRAICRDFVSFRPRMSDANPEDRVVEINVDDLQDEPANVRRQTRSDEAAVRGSLMIFSINLFIKK